MNINENPSNNQDSSFYGSIWRTPGQVKQKLKRVTRTVTEKFEFDDDAPVQKKVRQEGSLSSSGQTYEKETKKDKSQTHRRIIQEEFDPVYGTRTSCNMRGDIVDKDVQVVRIKNHNYTIKKSSEPYSLYIPAVDVMIENQARTIPLLHAYKLVPELVERFLEVNKDNLENSK
jgi:hypothetical protein